MRKFLILIILINILLAVTFIFSDKIIFSENENRNLTKFNDVTFSKILDGSFSKNIDDYINDHFPLREVFLSLNSHIKLLIGHKKINDVYINKGDLFLEYKNSNIKEIINNLNEFEEKNKMKMDFILIPTSSLVNENKLPLFINANKEKEDFKYISNNLKFNFINGYDILKNKENVYYKLDHHYNIYGAYEIYKQFSKQNNFKNHNINFEILNKQFQGTLYSKIHLFNNDVDTMHYYNNKNPIKMINNNKIYNSLYNYDYLTKKDKYSFYLGGNFPLLNIETNLNNKKEILIIKDSYANSFIPFLVNHYSNIHVIDLRFYNKSISEYIKEKNIKEVLFLYGISSLNESNLKNIR